jgi:uncharacterized protein YijF (DUF1287 family)
MKHLLLALVFSVVWSVVLPVGVAFGVPLGVADLGIFADLDARLELALPPTIPSAEAHAIVDRAHRLVVVYRGPHPVKVYPIGGPAPLRLGEDGAISVGVRDPDARELLPLLRGRPARELGPEEVMPPGDRDGDGIPDPLDVLIGAKKVVLNAASYGGDYIAIRYPGGDVPRDMGVCTDVVVRALRNAGIDLQKELHEDILRAPRAYPMVKRPDPNIDQRRVATLLPWFKRHWTAHGTNPAAVNDPFLPGDVVFLDTFPSRDGPDHVGIVSDTIGPSGLPLVVNNWTDGYHESEMDLLGSVPVLYRFRSY